LPDNLIIVEEIMDNIAECSVIIVSLKISNRGRSVAGEGGPSGQEKRKEKNEETGRRIS